MGSLVWGYVVHRTHTQLAWAPPPPPPLEWGEPQFQVSNLRHGFWKIFILVNILTNVHFLDTRNVLELLIWHLWQLLLEICIPVLSTRLISSRRKIKEMVSWFPTWNLFYKNLGSNLEVNLKMQTIIEFNLSNLSEDIWISNLAKNPGLSI